MYNGEYSKCHFLARMKAWRRLRPLVNGVVNNALFHSITHINQMLPHIIHILHCCLIDSLLNCAPRFCSQVE